MFLTRSLCPQIRQIGMEPREDNLIMTWQSNTGAGTAVVKSSEDETIYFSHGETILDFEG